MDKYDLTDAVRFALSGKPIEFEAAIKQDLAARVQDSVEAKREEIRQTMFRSPEEEVETPEAVEPVDTEEE